MKNHLLDIVDKQDSGEPAGIYSVCSSNTFVLKAAMLQALEDHSYLLIEPTANQVNQYGGYTGMKPGDFVNLISELASAVGFDREKRVLGGDHLGPHPWKEETAQDAMHKAEVLVREYVAAGFSKIHLDTSMPCRDDGVRPGESLDEHVVADRAAELCRVAEETYHKSKHSDQPPPVYVIGTEVPIPGGAEGSIHDIEVTSVDSASETIEITKKAFFKRGLEDAWERVIAQVVQPGVEFGNSDIVEYDAQKAAGLSTFINNYKGMVFEAHSTDYQPQDRLSELVNDGFAILKVGPWLTFSFREAIFALSFIEKELLSSQSSAELSNLQAILDQAMVNGPASWKGHYEGDDEWLKLLRKYSYSDRSRYYWQDASVRNAVQKLFANLEQHGIPLPLLSQFLPDQYRAITQGELENKPASIVLHKIQQTIGIYSRATGQA